MGDKERIIELGEVVRNKERNEYEYRKRRESLYVGFFFGALIGAGIITGVILMIELCTSCESEVSPHQKFCESKGFQYDSFRKHGCIHIEDRIVIEKYWIEKDSNGEFYLDIK